MALIPAKEAKYALDFGVSRSDLSLSAQLEYDRLVAEGYGAPPPPPPTKEERKQARRERHERIRRMQTEITWLPNLGVAVHDGNVYWHGVDQKGEHSASQAMNERYGRTELKLLGPLAGAHAEVVSGKTWDSAGKRMYDTVGNTIAFGPLGLISALIPKYQGFAVVSFADGSSWGAGLPDKQSLPKAQVEAVRFNTLASSAQHGAAAGPAEDGKGVAAELERLTALHESGALDDEEFRAAKARIIHGG